MIVASSMANPAALSVEERYRGMVRRPTSDGALLYGSLMVANGLGYLLFMLLARILSVEEYGEVVTLTASVYFLAILVRSIQAQAAQLASSAAGREDPAAYASAILRQSVGWTAVGAGLIFGLIWMFSPRISEFLNLNSPALVVLLGAYLASDFILPVPRGLLLGLGRLRYASLVYLIEPLARMGIALLLVATPLRTIGVIFAYFAGKLVAYLFAAWPFATPGQNVENPALAGSRLWSLGKPFVLALVANTALMVLGTIDPFAIKHFFSAAQAGQFSVAFLLGRVILLSTMAASWVTFSATMNLRMQNSQARTPLANGLLLGGGIAGLGALIYWLAPEAVSTALGGQVYRAAGDFVGLVGLEMVLFTLISIQAYYHIAVQTTRLILPFVLALVMEIVLLSVFHGTPYQVIYDTLATLGVLFVWTSLLTVRAFSPRRAAKEQPIPLEPAMRG